MPRELKDRLDEHNRMNPYSKISLSKITQKAVYEALNDAEKKERVKKKGEKNGSW